MAARFIATSVCSVALCGSSHASIIYSSTDHDAWFNAVEGPVTTIGFSEVIGQIVTEQYAFLGAHFTDGNDYGISNPNYTDGFGVKGHIDSNASPIAITFDDPMYWIAVDYPGNMKFDLYNNQLKIGTIFGPIGGGSERFLGIVSDIGFTKIVMSDYADGLPFVDNLYFGTHVPAPSAMLIMGFCQFGNRRRRL
jgi:hypothetical protein